MQKNFFNRMRMAVCALLFLNALPFYAETKDDPEQIIFRDVWSGEDGLERSLPSFSVRAYTDGLAVYIYNVSPSVGMDVRIENEWDEVMIRRTVSEAESVCVTVSIGSLPAGSYTLVLENEDKGCLEGEFEKR